jgi:hypothetical protein
MSTQTAPPAVPPSERRHYPRRWRRARRALYGLLGLMVLGVIAYLGLRNVEPPHLHLVMPTHARVGDVVILSGAGFSAYPEKNVVYVGDYAARVLEAARTQLLIEVPDMALDPAERRKTPVTVTVGSTRSESVELIVEPPTEPEPGTEAPEDDEASPSPPPLPTTRPTPGR